VPASGKSRLLGDRAVWTTGLSADSLLAVVWRVGVAVQKFFGVVGVVDFG
jgi:hypothetical protein